LSDTDFLQRSNWTAWVQEPQKDLDGTKMSDRNYIGISGYIGGDPGRDEFAKIWLKNLDQNPDFNPQKIVVLCSRGERPPIHCGITDFIVCKGDLGHINHPSHRHQVEGWPVALMTGLLVAYNNESDAIWIEQDCLPFGPFVSQMYSEIRDGVGVLMGSVSIESCAQALMLVRHWMIPELVHGFMGKKIGNKHIHGEDAFSQMEKEMNGKFQRFSFGYDRDRPPEGFASMKDSVWYLQQISFDEVRQLRELGFLK
jgi:hypothetical protein